MTYDEISKQSGCCKNAHFGRFHYKDITKPSSQWDRTSNNLKFSIRLNELAVNLSPDTATKHPLKSFLWILRGAMISDNSPGNSRMVSNPMKRKVEALFYRANLSWIKQFCLAYNTLDVVTCSTNSGLKYAVMYKLIPAKWRYEEREIIFLKMGKAILTGSIRGVTLGLLSDQCANHRLTPQINLGFFLMLEWLLYMFHRNRLSNMPYVSNKLHNSVYGLVTLSEDNICGEDKHAIHGSI